MKTLLEMLSGIFAPDRSVETRADDDDAAPARSGDARWAEALLACEHDHNAQLYLDLYRPIC